MSAWAHFALVALASGAESAVSPLSTHPRYTGSPVVRTWLAEDYGASPVNTRVVQHPRTGCIYVSNERGVLEFDGVRWRLIPTPNQQIVTGLSVDGRGRIWGCGRSALFRLEPDARGELQARSMLDRLPAKLRTGISVGDCVATAQGVFFRETRNLIFFGLDEGPAKVWPATEGNAVTLSLWQIADEPYVNLGRGVVLRLRNDRLEPVPSIASRVLDTRATPEGAYQVLAPASLDRWDGTRRTVVHSPLGKDFAQNATFLADGRMVFATLNSGLIVCDREGRFLQKIDRTNGLPANNVNHVFEDREGGVWAALRYGIARVQLDSPYALHGPAQGREGTTLSLALSGGELFVAGTENAVRRRANGQFRPVQEARGPDREVIAHADRVYFLGLRLRSLRPALGNETTELEVRNYYGLVPVTTAPGWFAHGSNEGLRWAHFTGEKWVSEGPLKTRLGSATAVLEAPASVIWCANLGVAWRIDFRAGLRADAPTQRFSLAEGLPSPLAGMFLLGREVVAAGGGKLVRFNEATRRFEPETRVAELEGFPIERAHRSPGGSVWLQGGPPTREVRRIEAVTADQWRAARLPGGPLTRLLPTALLEDAALQTVWIGGHGALISRDLTWQPTRPAVAPTAVVRRIETAGAKCSPRARPRPARRPHPTNSRRSRTRSASRSPRRFSTAITSVSRARSIARGSTGSTASGARGRRTPSARSPICRGAPSRFTCRRATMRATPARRRRSHFPSGRPGGPRAGRGRRMARWACLVSRARCGCAPGSSTAGPNAWRQSSRAAPANSPPAMTCSPRATRNSP